MDLFNLAAKIALDSSEYEKGLGKAEEKTKSFGSKLKSGLGTAAKAGAAAIAATGAATVALTKSVIDGASATAQYGDTIDKQSQKVGLSAKVYQEWDYVLKISGTEMSNMTTGLKTLTNKFDDAKNGSAGAIETFEKLGLSMKDIQNLSREELFEQTIYAFQGMEDSAERAALANDLFGRSGQELAPLFNATAEETKGLIKQVNDLGGVMSDDAVKSSAAYQDSLTAMQTSFSGLKRGILGDFMPSITTVMDGITELFSTGGNEKITKGIEGFIDKIGETIPKILDKGGQILVALSTSLIKNLPKLIKSTITIVKTFADNLLSSDKIEMIIGAAIEIITTIANGLTEALPKFIPAIIMIITTLVEKLTDSNSVKELVNATLQIVETLATGLIDNLPALLEAAWELAKALAEALLEYDWWGLAKKIFSSIKNALKNIFTKESEGNGEVTEQPHGRHASGLKYVPFDEYHAVLHKGERVLTASEAKEYPYASFETITPANNEESGKSVEIMRKMLEEMQAMRRDMFDVILTALRTNSDDFDGSEKDMIRLVKKYAFA